MRHQGERPTGGVGVVVGRLMNAMHTRVYDKCLRGDLPNHGSAILDLGCGGGAFLRYLSRRSAAYRLVGIDHSPEMVHLARATNRAGIARGQVEILEGRVGDTSFDGRRFDLVTALETVQFWPDVDASFAAIALLLCRGGVFVIVNRYPRPGTGWWHTAAIKTDAEFVSRLRATGFKEVSVDLRLRRGWIIVKATR